MPEKHPAEHFLQTVDMQMNKRFWIGLSLVNLAIVALLGWLMRTKMLFPLPFFDYKNILNAHSHFAFCGWVGLSLTAFLVYDVLPAEARQKKIYRRCLWGIELCSLGMLFSFPFWGYNVVSIVFSTAYIFVTYFFGWAFFRDIRKSALPSLVKWLCFGSVGSLMLSSVGPYILSFIMATKSGNSLLYRDAIYTFLHLQYNGFFTLGVFAIFFSNWLKKGFTLPASAKKFSVFLVFSVVPSLFASLLWHNLALFYVLAAIGGICIVVSIIYFIPVFRFTLGKTFFQFPLAKWLWLAAFLSFIIKMTLNIGTLYPPLGQAVYGARPVIIGFLHLVFLAFISFYILSNCIEGGYFSTTKRVIAVPFYVFGTGVFANELFLFIQGLEILFRTNSGIYNWLLWFAAILLLTGAVSLVFSFYYNQAKQKKAAAFAAAS